MLVAALLVPVAIAVVVIAVYRFGVPAFLALMFVAIGYGLATDLPFKSVDKAFALGFSTAMEQVGLLIVAGSLVGGLLPKYPLPGPAAGAVGLLAGMGGAGAEGLALLQHVGVNAPRRALALALGVLAFQPLIAPSPLAVAPAVVLKAELGEVLWFALPAAAVAGLAGWLYIRRQMSDGSRTGALSWRWLAIVVPLGVLVLHAVAQLPSAPLGRAETRELLTGLSRPLMLAAMAIALAVLLSGRWQPAVLADTRWATLLLTVGAAGGFSRVLDEIGIAELLAERVLTPQLGLLVPFLAAAIVKTMQGNSLTAVLTASGMIEPMLPALGLDGAASRAIAAAAVGAGSIAICHINDPFFWIATKMAGLSPGQGLRTLSLGSLIIAVAALIVLAVLRLVL
ncbi:gluconate:H+ symporter, GntP family [Enhydrobacter aerosaccus]|uniref:Gluconate:H+ symporter, GntP family n=1 Tax=Enhydrobacter aerosaccus TaxID=225324 RepID=A0A1T4R304_9HYPH|nr:hypothetical protein [Enhydrobacter aerosaccus]SKA10442.1 gluconate:H+ symporter, GntP family [Enhydrobacter aerosaccus]